MKARDKRRRRIAAQKGGLRSGAIKEAKLRAKEDEFRATKGPWLQTGSTCYANRPYCKQCHEMLEQTEVDEDGRHIKCGFWLGVGTPPRESMT